MMKHLLLVVLTLCVSAMTDMAQAQTIRVLTDRTESHLKPLFNYFEKKHGIKIEAVYVAKGMYARLQARPDEADIVISKTAGNLERARREGLLQAIESPAISGLAKEFRDAENMYFLTSYRSRGLYISKTRIKQNEVLNYMDLIKPQYKGRVVLRSGYHDYNISLFCQMMESWGADKTKQFLTGLKANLARLPQGNDRAQVRAIHEGVADISIGNGYYMGIMRHRKDQKAWADATAVVFPDQGGKGTFIMRSAAGLTKAKRNVKQATELLDFLVGDFAQYYMTSTLHVYPVIDSLPLSAECQTFGSMQDDVTKGKFKANFIALRDVDKHREAVIKLLNDLNFDK